MSLSILYSGLLFLNIRGHATLAARLFILILFGTITLTIVMSPANYLYVTHLYVIVLIVALFTLGIQQTIFVGVLLAALHGAILFSLRDITFEYQPSSFLWLASTLESIFIIYLLIAGSHLLTRSRRQYHDATMALDLSEKRYRLLFENAPVGLALLDAEGKFILANPQLAELWGVDPAQLIGTTGDQFLNGELQEKIRAYRSEILQSSEPTYQELCVEIDGHLRWFDLTSLWDSEGHILVTAREVTSRKINEQILAQKARLVEMVSNAIIETDANFCVTSWNAAAEKIYGYTAEEAIGKRLSELVGGNSESVKDSLPTLLKYGQWSGEVQQCRKDGTPVLIFSSVRVLRDENDQIIGFLGVNADITPLQALDDERYRNQQIQLMMRRYSRNLRDPLAAIMLNVHMLQSATDDAMRQSVAESLQRSVEHFERQIRSLLLISYLADDDMSYQMPIEEVDLAALLDDVCQRNLLYAQQQGQTLETHLPSHLIIEGGFLELDKAFDDLLTFCLRRTDINGKLQIYLKTQEEHAQIQIVYDAKNSTMKTIRAVLDHPEQIDDAQLARARELEMVRKIITLSKGVLDAEYDVVAERTTFTITLPLRLKEAL
ncbi:MAG: hypothetical protein CUN55_11425 [Phototrophicales bacterium]|nr:MAG: hypothetical protein CUN55_11425 [Phototrophicales bacterium]